LRSWQWHRDSFNLFFFESRNFNSSAVWFYPGLIHSVRVWYIQSGSDTFSPGLIHSVRVLYIQFGSDTYSPGLIHSVRVWYIQPGSVTFSPILIHSVRSDTFSPVCYIQSGLIHSVRSDIFSTVWYIQSGLIHSVRSDTFSPVWYMQSGLIHAVRSDIFSPVWYIQSESDKFSSHSYIKLSIDNFNPLKPNINYMYRNTCCKNRIAFRSYSAFTYMYSVQTAINSPYNIHQLVSLTQAQFSLWGTN
jgi:hypothetical protein